MAQTPNQLAWRRRIETGIRVAEPGLNLLLAFGDRFSRWVDRNQPDTYAPARRVGGEEAQRRVARGDAGPGAS